MRVDHRGEFGVEGQGGVAKQWREASSGVVLD